jgi:DtxR family transcriptional regulator, Mn-dependent transcriptional regulator
VESLRPELKFHHAEFMIDDLTKSEQETLKAIYRHTQDQPEAHTGDLAETLGVTPGTVTAAVKRLADRRLVDHRPYHGVRFTQQGRRLAVAAIRRHRIVERFLADMLGYPWNEADRLAPTFEHDLPDEVTDRLFVALNRPTTCPHGFPIPEPAQDEIPALPPLYDLDAGDVAEVAVPGSTEPDVVRFLDGLGVRPGVEIEVREKHPFDGPIVLRVSGEDRTLGERVARQIFVQPISTARHGDRAVREENGDRAVREADVEEAGADGADMDRHGRQAGHDEEAPVS